jgi:hypothetical protein
MYVSDWWFSRGLSRATGYRLIQLAGIKAQRVRCDGYRSLRSFLTDEQVLYLDNLAEMFLAGLSIPEITDAVYPPKIFDDHND